MNKTSMQRGMTVSTSLKKYSDTIRKNTVTGQDDIFMKPDRNKVSGMMDANFYNKLNEKGYVPEETVINNGDVIIGKVSPIQAGANNKSYKDESEIYKSTVPGIVDKVYTGIYDADGYEMYNMRIRSERIPMIGDKLCMTPDHEILTDKGWINITELKMEDKIACLNDNQMLNYQHPLELISYEYEGKMYSVESNQVHLCVTPNHDMWVSTRDGKYKKERADEILNKRRYYKKNVDGVIIKKNHKYFVYNDKKRENDDDEYNLITHFKIGEEIYDAKAWVELFGIWMAEGFVSKNCNQLIIAAHKPRVKEALTKLISKLNLHVNKQKDDYKIVERNMWHITNKNISDYMRQFSLGAINKSLPEWVWYLTPKLCNVLIDGMVLGDGHTIDNGTRRYDTSSKQLADDFQRLCLHAGYAANIITKYEAGHTAIITGSKSKNNIEHRIGEKITSTVDAYRITIIETQLEPLVNKNVNLGKVSDKMIDYKGMVYCCTAPDIGVIYVRKNKIPVWTGNCSRHGKLLA